ncbi:MAG: aldehyde dehydrogenase family protein [Alphaproteobacteria bacterium]|nr:aldehyde dehydrogenase family protein [Alphaproteobacteria bacterium]
MTTKAPTVAEIFETMEYGPALENTDAAQAWLDEHKRTFNLFINGKFVTPESNAWFATTNPATDEKLGDIAQASEKDVNAAVKAARAAQKPWQALSGHERAKYLYAIARLMQKHARLFAVLEVLDNGKPFRETRDADVPLVARHFYHHAGWAQLLESEFPDYEACGVVGQVIPWNFPLLMMAWKIAPALAAGNTVVLKPAEFTSLTALLFAEICQEAGLPKGVVNIITGDGTTGAAVTTHPGIDKLAFTGSTEVGRIIRKAAAGTGKSLTIERGGKAPIIVFEDADLDSAVEGVVDAIWFNQGEVCCGGSRLLLQEGITEKFIAKLKTRMETLRLGNPLDKCTDIGAVVDKSQMENIQRMIDIGVKEGGILYQPSWDCPDNGCFVAPALFTNVTPTATLAQEEIFGPVIVAMTFRTSDEALDIANNSRYGLAASLWSENLNLALDIVPKLKCGVVWVNTTNQFDAACGFGGVKESGFGREGGKEGMYAYLKPKFMRDLPNYAKAEKLPSARLPEGVTSIDRTAKLYVGGKQTRPDGEVCRKVLAHDGILLGEVGDGNRKDIRNAVEAARKASGWAGATQHNKAQILYYIAENLSARADEFANRIRSMTGCTDKEAQKEVQTSIERLFTYAAWADKYDGAVHAAPLRNITLALNEAVGVIGILCPDEAPLLGFISLIAPAIAMGNTVLAVPSERFPLAATDFYQILDTSDLPAGVINIITGQRDVLAKTLAEHDNVDAVWYFGPQADGSALVEEHSTGNLKRSFCNYGKQRDWYNRTQSEGQEFLRHATQVKNIWVPYGEVNAKSSSY